MAIECILCYKTLKMKKSYFIAFIIAFLALIWIGSGFLVSNDDRAPQENIEKSEPKKDLMKVQFKKALFEPYTKKITLNGRSEASKNVTIRAEAEGQVTEILHEQGEQITKGEDIVKINIQERSVRVREARELVKQRKIEYEAARELIKQGFASNVRLAQTQSAYESARASLKRSQIDLEKTTILAPFDGVLGKRHVDIGDYLRVGDEVTDIVDLNPLKIAVFVNEKEIVQLKKGNSASLNFAGGERREGVVAFIAPAADMQSRTFRVEIEMNNEINSLPAGLTAQVDIEVLSKQAVKIPPSVLTLNDDGAVGVKIIDADSKAQFQTIEILEDTANHLWVKGVENGARIVMVGQDFLVPGQMVEAIKAE